MQIFGVIPFMKWQQLNGENDEKWDGELIKPFVWFCLLQCLENSPFWHRYNINNLTSRKGKGKKMSLEIVTGGKNDKTEKNY